MIKKFPFFNPKVINTDQTKNYCFVRDHELGQNQKESIEQMWESYIDICPDDLQKFLTDAQKNSQFDDCIWQMRVTCVLKNLGYNVVPTSKKGPDILIDDPGFGKIYIEAVCAHDEIGYERLKAGWIDENRIILRITNALSQKYDKYVKWLNDGVISSSDKFVIAVNTGDVYLADNKMDPKSPVTYLVRAACPVGQAYMQIGIPGGEHLGTGHHIESQIKKREGVSVEKNIFSLERSEGIIGILSSTENIHNSYGLTMGEDMEFLHNPMIKNSLPLEYFRYFDQKYADESGHLAWLKKTLV